MKRAQTRCIELGASWVLCQYTPHRITSVSARVDPVSVRKRPCFLCPQNLYPEEKGLAYTEDYLILCNVSPIFDLHLVITHCQHVPQSIQPHFDMALRVAQDLSPDFVLIYNGPRCGASAPDHLHLQAFPAQNLPLPAQLWVDDLSGADGIVMNCETIRIAAPTGFSRNFLTFESRDPSILSHWFRQTLQILAQIEPVSSEPMINLVMAHGGKGWKMILFPRGKHRPDCYHREGDNQLLISPGAIDMAGVFVIPRQRDFHRVDATILRDIYKEVSLDENRFSRVIAELIRRK